MAAFLAGVSTLVAFLISLHGVVLNCLGLWLRALAQFIVSIASWRTY